MKGRMGIKRDWGGTAVEVGVVLLLLLILTLVILIWIPVEKGQAVVSAGHWVTWVELVEERTIRGYVCRPSMSTPGAQDCRWEKDTETVVLKRRELHGDWSEEAVWAERFTTYSDQYNRQGSRFTITYQFNDVAYRGNVSQREFATYYLGMPCEIWLNIYGQVIRDRCGQSAGR